MSNELTWVVGGQQGEGIDTTGEILASALNRLGYHIFGYRTFGSRIKGGHTNYRVRIAQRPVYGIAPQIDVLVAFDQDTINRLAGEMARGGVVVFNGKGGRGKLPPGVRDVRLVEVPMLELARELGNPIMKNMVGVGVSAALLGLAVEDIEPVVDERFAGKGGKLVEANKAALRRGYEAALAALGETGDRLRLGPADGRRRYLMTGDEAAAFGALVAGCRLVAAYPITPASEIMHWMVKKLPQYGGVVVQAEDEIAAISTVIGAGYAGVRAMTSTSGPGFSLMQEAIGYAGMIEAPCVIVNVQRAGPSTGMPTKHEQSDLFEMVMGSHGDLPRIVLAPVTIEDCFYAAVDAFNLADRYQTPVVLAMDLALGLSKQTVDDIDFSRVRIDRGEIAVPDDLNWDGGDFKRYRFTETGISPRSLPGMPGGLHLATGLEHDETGHITEDRGNRVRMMQKRLRKFAAVNGIETVRYEGPEHPDVLLVGWGASYGALREAREALGAQGLSVGHAHIRLLAPFPVAAVADLLGRAKHVFVAENNALGQLAALIRQHVDSADKARLRTINKYDGTLFLPGEIVEPVLEAVSPLATAAKEVG
ncbi:MULTISPECIES: 2-oxoacid:acceptor oxidoreductase subunit alpha [Thermaerobacter]|uniref:2-oxoacid:acceptor oxidoreductase subunit alpha n=1 Tax=Thermaerobacter composti TaxID=554949 RepID=A0ABZ0QKV5_9FIRM|nr:MULTISPECIES: 2-oxoacid:acceptor oxidoreductase subunit alpha [Thermaerobacter]QBS38107.1 2-oxoacid:acceptor oxidoreductase subunit alpha [Thermaerobacter sp. FW80]WPD18132.1 2-oxoacid:acceptor oxidoreductase subunit alpha [Thermaerobacter composti]